MLNAGLFEGFKGATTLLLWGDRAGMALLLGGIADLLAGRHDCFAVDATDEHLDICITGEPLEKSSLRRNSIGLSWQCSRPTLELASEKVEALLGASGHHFLDLEGLGEQVIISRDEYPPILR